MAPFSSAQPSQLLWCAVALAARGSVGIDIPGSKLAINGMAVMIRQHVAWNNWGQWSTAMAPFWADNFTYDFVYPFGKTQGLRDWYLGEHLHYNEAFPGFKSTNFLFLGEGDRLASLQSYHTVWWKGSFGGVPAPGDAPLIKIKDLDFYIIEGKKILYNWCMVDVVGIMQQGGYDILPPAPLPDGIDYLPPRAMDGVPSPDDRYVKAEDTDAARKVFRQMLQEDFVEQSPEGRWWAQDLQWCGPAGIGLARTPEEYVRHFLTPLHKAFPKPTLEIGSTDCEGTYCGALFYLEAEHAGEWLGEQATGKRVRMKLGMHARVDLAGGGNIADAWVQLDIVEAFSQMGIDLLGRAKEQHAQRMVGGARRAEVASLAASPETRVSSAPLAAGCLLALLAALAVLLWVVRPGGLLIPRTSISPEPLLA